MVLKIDGRKVIIKGEPELLKKDASLKSMLKALHQGEGFLIDYHHIQTEINWKEIYLKDCLEIPADETSISYNGYQQSLFML